MYILYHGNYRPELDTCTRCVVTDTEGSIPGDTAATTSSQLRRSDRGGFLLLIVVCLYDYFSTCVIRI